MRKVLFLVLIITIPLVILAATHLHSQASTIESISDYDTISGADLGWNFFIDKTAGILFYFDFTLPNDPDIVINTSDFGFCSNHPTITNCEIEMEMKMYLQKRSENARYATADSNGMVGFSWESVKEFRDRENVSRIHFKIDNSHFSYQRISDGTTHYVLIPDQQKVIKDEDLKDSKMNVCNGSDQQSIYESEWPAYEAYGYKKGKCYQINICQDEEMTLKIWEYYWPQYASTSTKGNCPVKTCIGFC